MNNKRSTAKQIFGEQGRSRAHTDLVHKSMTLIPGGTTTAAVPLPGHEFIIERGEGAYVYDVDDRKYLDYFMGSGPLVLGHAHPKIIKAIARASEKGTHHIGLHRRTLELTERIVAAVPNAEQVRYTASGTEATMHALRLARVATGRSDILKFDGAYHGHHDLVVWSIDKTTNPLPHPSPESAGTEASVADHVWVLPFNDPAAFREFMAENGHKIAAVICEPLQRSIPPLPGFLETLRDVTSDSGSVLVFDEIVTGFRLAAGGAQERYNVVPDLAVIGKALAGGAPLAAVLGSRELMSHFEPGQSVENYSFHCGTFSGFHLGAECAHTVLDVLIDEGGIEYLNMMGENYRQSLRRVFHDLGIDAQVIGDGPVFETFFTALPIKNQEDIRNSDRKFAAAFHRCLYEAGIYKSAVKTYLSTAHGEDEMNELTAAAKWAVKKLTR